MPIESNIAPTGSAAPRLSGFFGSAESPAAAKARSDYRDKEGGHMSSTQGRVVLTPGAALPYKVVLTHEGLPLTELAFATMREAEACIRRNTPRPIARNILRDAPADFLRERS